MAGVTVVPTHVHSMDQRSTIRHSWIEYAGMGRGGGRMLSLAR